MIVIATLCVSVSLDCKERRDDEFENRKRFCEVIVIAAGQRVNITNGKRFRRIVFQIKMPRFHTRGD